MTLDQVTLRSIVVVGFAALFGLSGCGSEPPPQGVSNETAPAVYVTEVRQQTVPIFVEYVARTEAFSDVEIRARVEGILEEVFFQDGELVKKGQLLFRIEQDPYQASIQNAEADLARAEAELTMAEKQVQLIKAKAELAEAQALKVKAEQDVARLEPLAAERAVPRQELDAAIAARLVADAEMEAAEATVQNTELSTETYILQARAAVESAKAALTQAQLDLNYTEIRSPIDGRIGRRLVDAGNLVGRGETTLLARIASVNPIKAVFGISETDYIRLAKRVLLRDEDVIPDQPEDRNVFELILADDSVFAHKGELIAIDNIIDIETGTLTLETQFPNPDRLLRPNQFARIRFPIEQKENAVLIPERSIMRVQGNDLVFVLSADNTVQQRSISAEGSWEGFAILKQGVNVGERIILEGHQKVRPGVKVTPSTKAANQED